jgi:hypothetical protein
VRVKINGRDVEVEGETLSFDQIVSHAHQVKVSYESSDDQGVLFPGESVEIEDGMIFTVVNAQLNV